MLDVDSNQLMMNHHNAAVPLDSAQTSFLILFKVWNCLMIFMDSFESMETCLSPAVKELVMHTGISPTSRPVLKENFCLDWDIIEETVAECFEDEANEPLKCYKEAISRAAPFFKHVEDTFRDLDLLSVHYDNFWWMGSLQTQMTHVSTLMSSGQQEDLYVAGLIMTSCLERSLGNLILLKKKFVPPLLKDVLESPELTEVIGSTATMSLKLVIGCPASLNLRNLLWHGFLSPGEIRSRYFYFLMATASSIGYKLKGDGMTREIIRGCERKLDTLSEDKDLSKIFPVMSQMDSEEFKSCLKDSPQVMNCFLSLWDYALRLNFNSRHGLSLVLLFPLLESYLRFIFSYENCLPHRFLSAQTYEMYTTFSEIMNPFLDEDLKIPNRFVDFFGESKLEMLSDVLFNPEGLRLRDRISHGQIDLCTVDSSITNHIICLSHHLIHYSLKTSGVRHDISEEFYGLENYRSIYHTNSKLEMVFQEILDTLLEFPSDACQDLKSQISHIQNEFHIIHFPTLFRSKDETSHSIFLRKICESIVIIGTEVTKRFCTLRQLMSRKELRSRQRLNLERLRDAIPVIQTVLYEVTLVVFRRIFHMFTQRILLDDHKVMTDKELNSIHSCLLNMKTASQQNNWGQTLKYCQIIKEVIKR